MRVPQSGDVGTRITIRCFITLKSQMKHILGCKGQGLKIWELERNFFYDCESWRKQTKPNTLNVTIRNEQSTINRMMNFAYREGYAHLPQQYLWPMSIHKEDVGRRAKIVEFHVTLFLIFQLDILNFNWVADDVQVVDSMFDKGISVDFFSAWYLVNFA